MDKKIKEVFERDSERRLSISRVPVKVREEFVAFAKEEFEGDYGMCLREIWEKYKQWSSFMHSHDSKLNYIITLLELLQHEEDTQQNIKLLDGGSKARKGE